MAQQRSKCDVLEDARLESGSPMIWDMGFIAADFANWIFNPQKVQIPVSRIGILSSNEFEHLISKFMGTELCRHFRSLVKISSIFQGRDKFSSLAGSVRKDLEFIRSFDGSKVLQQLDLFLSNVSPAKTPSDQIKALFLELFGTILAVGRSSALFNSRGVRVPPRG